MVAEGALKYAGHCMATVLASLGRPTAVGRGRGRESASTSPRPRLVRLCPDVQGEQGHLWAHALLANGGIIAPAGTHACCVAAGALRAGRRRPRHPQAGSALAQGPKAGPALQVLLAPPPGEISGMGETVGREFVAAARAAARAGARRTTGSAGTARARSRRTGRAARRAGRTGDREGEAGRQRRGRARRRRHRHGGGGRPREDPKCGSLGSAELASINPRTIILRPDLVVRDRHRVPLPELRPGSSRYFASETTC